MNRDLKSRVKDSIEKIKSAQEVQKRSSENLVMAIESTLVAPIDNEKLVAYLVKKVMVKTSLLGERFHVEEQRMKNASEAKWNLAHLEKVILECLKGINQDMPRILSIKEKMKKRIDEFDVVNAQCYTKIYKHAVLENHGLAIQCVDKVIECLIRLRNDTLVVMWENQSDSEDSDGYTFTEEPLVSVVRCVKKGV